MISIGAEAARWAGLQIDLNSKYRAGKITADQLWRFINLSPKAREECFGNLKRPTMVASVVPTEKFGLLVDLGIITVPADYDHMSQLSSFKSNNRYRFYSYNHDITDVNFWNPTRILKPGDRLWVRAHKQIILGTTTSRERLAFLESLGSHHTGAQGASLVFEQKRDQLPKGYWYVSFDEKYRLWEDEQDRHMLPAIHVNSHGVFSFLLSDFERPWRDFSRAFLSFCDEPVLIDTDK